MGAQSLSNDLSTTYSYRGTSRSPRPHRANKRIKENGTDSARGIDNRFIVRVTESPS